MVTKEYLIEILKENKVFEEGDFTLASGKKSNYYVNMKRAITEPEILSTIAKLINEEIDDEEGTIESIIVAKGGIQEALNIRKSELVIPFDTISKIGDKVFTEKILFKSAAFNCRIGTSLLIPALLTSPSKRGAFSTRAFNSSSLVKSHRII